MVEWKPIRDILALGKDKHGLFSEIYDIQNGDDHRLKQARDWMLANNFNAISADYVEFGSGSIGNEHLFEEEKELKCNGLKNHFMDQKNLYYTTSKQN